MFVLRIGFLYVRLRRGIGLRTRASNRFFTSAVNPLRVCRYAYVLRKRRLFVLLCRFLVRFGLTFIGCDRIFSCGFFLFGFLINKDIIYGEHGNAYAKRGVRKIEYRKILRTEYRKPEILELYEIPYVTVNESVNKVVADCAAYYKRVRYPGNQRLTAIPVHEIPEESDGKKGNDYKKDDYALLAQNFVQSECGSERRGVIVDIGDMQKFGNKRYRVIQIHRCVHYRFGNKVDGNGGDNDNKLYFRNFDVIRYGAEKAHDFTVFLHCFSSHRNWLCPRLRAKAEICCPPPCEHCR